MNKQIVRIVRDASGATAIEYGLIAALVAVVIIAGLTAFGEGLQAWYQDIADGLGNA